MSNMLDRINELQQSTGMPAKHVAIAAGINSSSFTEWNKGKAKPSLDAVVKLATYFNVSLDYLILGKTDSVTLQSQLDFSNFQNAELNEKYNQLPPDMQIRVLAYIDGMLAAIPGQEKGTLLG